MLFSWQNSPNVWFFFCLYFIIDIECDRGSYGIECNENGNGSCSTGCDAGFKGDLCKTGE